MLARGRRAEQALFAGLTLPATLVLLVVVFLPIFWLSSLSFLDRAGDPSLENYRRLAGDIYVDAFLVTFQISATVTATCVALGYPLAYWLARQRPRVANLLLICVLLPFWTAVLVRTYAWLVLLQRRGLVNSTLQSLGIIDQPLQLAFNLQASIIGMVHVMLPFLVLPLYASMKAIDGDLVRAAIGLGSTPTGAFWRVFVPMSLPGLFAGVVLVFVLSLGFYVTPALLGGGRIQMIAQRIESTITIFSNWGAASALGVVLLAMALGLVALLHRAFGLDRLFVR
ncbi:MAG: ABC transporter permease [Alphaproteobacteria bacterium]|nr:ABC transporter permease [Alphaproteobacteria bacterium]MBM3626633.1 ABC transporter permease [Alphaproteobacteria bacterium]